jgi:hypothetical protein
MLDSLPGEDRREMQAVWSTRFLLLMVVLLSGMLLASSVSAAARVVKMTLGQNVILPWTMSGCWEQEIFIPKSAAPIAKQTAPAVH